MLQFIDDDHNTIDVTKNNVIINNISYPVTRILLFTPNDGKLITNEHIVKYNKGKLYLYDLKQTLIKEYKQNLEENEVNVNSVSNRLILNKFRLTNDVTLTLYKENTRYFINDTSVIRVYNNGFDTVYETDKKDKLQVSTRRHTTWNGCPIKSIV